MPRSARRVVPGLAHHITQRGTNRQTVFFARRDRRVYLDLLRDQASKTGVRILAYCLMNNHIHLIAIPCEEDALAVCLRRVHGRYAQYLNARRGRTGHLWQNRFFSCPLDAAHLLTALRYVECNPVRAGLVATPVEFAWSSAVAHGSGKDQSRLLDMQFWEDQGGLVFWQQLLHSEEDETEYQRLRRATYSGRPLGSVEQRAVSRRTSGSEVQAKSHRGAA